MNAPVVVYEPPKRTRTDYRTGLSAWTDKSMLEEGHFYPNSTFYALPGFLFNVQAYAKKPRTNDRARGVKDVILAE